MSYPGQEYTMVGYNRLIFDETSYDPKKLKEQHATLYGSLTTEQKGIYSTVMNVVDNNKGGMFFVYGYGGTGKTYLYKTMSAALCSKGEIVLNVASSGIAALLTDPSMVSDKVFGGKVVLFGGDFRKILPIITNGGRQDDDKEYIDGLLEASLWGMGDYLCSIFVMLIMTDSMSRPEIVWEKT
nr:ATP-dependent DNA helicase PIF1 [Tanacetum cinerariifolium]